MTGTQVFDRLALGSHSPSDHAGDTDAFLARLAEQMVAASITSGKMLRELRERMFPTAQEGGDLSVAQTLRNEFEQWVSEAEAVFEKARRVEKAGPSVPRLGELRDLVGLTRAMLQVSLADHLRSLQQISSGRTVSVEELRRELQLKRGR